jgi:transposase
VGRVQVGRWRQRYLDNGLSGIERDAPRGGRKSTVDEAKIVRLTTQTLPEGATQWSTRALAQKVGVSDTTVLRVWRKHGLKPHLVEQFKVSRDPKFIEKLEDIVGLYLNPPERALVLCCDEKSQVQALDRTQPGLPLKPGRAATMTHDYKRHGTTTLFAALDVKSGIVIGECQPRHRAKEFIRFLKKIDRTVKNGLDLHLIMDNYGTHKTAEVRAWLDKHPRFKLHFIPTSSSWLNLVERFFAEITGKRIRRGTFRSVAELEEAIDDYLLHHNASAKPYVWTKNADEILAKERRALDKLEAIKSGYQASDSEH